MKKLLFLNKICDSRISAILVVALLAGVVAFAFQGTRGLYETTEGRYAEVAREMLEKGNYLVPTLDYRPHWTKPPFFYWIEVAGIKVFGLNEWGLRTGNALAFLLTSVCVSFFGVSLWDWKRGFVAGLIYVSSPFPVFAANALSTDTVLTLWEVLAVFFYVKAYREIRVKVRRFFICGMWLAFALGFLTKGPPALLPFLAILVWNLKRERPVKLFYFAGIFVFLIVGFSWFSFVIYRNPELLDYFLRVEVLERVASEKGHNPQWYAPITVFLPVLVLGQGAWLYFTLRGMISTFKAGVKNFILNIKKREETAFLFLWILIPLIVFSFSKSRLHLYVLPLYAPVSLLIANHVCEEGLWGTRRILIVATFSIVILVTLKWIVAIYPNRNDMRAVYEAGIRLGGRGAHYYVFSEDKLYGLEFYMEGKLQRVAGENVDHRFNMKIDDLLYQISTGTSGGRHLILVSRNKLPEFERFLSRYSLRMETGGSDKWIWFSLSKQE
ncbi:MAG: glycosyltransferase family 39 protein [Syntrophales bacterium]|nr:glycosyltransferase family 39 protein [Syntrophales bacterium]